MVDILGELILFFILAVISLLFHEIGHIVATRLFQAKTIQLIIGVGKSIGTFHIGRTEVRIQRLFFINFITSSCRPKSYTSMEKVIISLMGPIFSILLAVIFYLFYQSGWAVSLMYLVYLFNIWIGIINLIPFKIGQKTSDGYTIYKILTTLT